MARETKAQRMEREAAEQAAKIVRSKIESIQGN